MTRVGDLLVGFVAGCALVLTLCGTARAESAVGQLEPTYPPNCWAQPPKSNLWYPCGNEPHELHMSAPRVTTECKPDDINCSVLVVPDGTYPTIENPPQWSAGKPRIEKGIRLDALHLLVLMRTSISGTDGYVEAIPNVIAQYDNPYDCDVMRATLTGSTQSHMYLVCVPAEQE